MENPFYNGRAKPTALWSKDWTAVFKNEPKKAIVFVDGSNWYHKLRKLLTVGPTGRAAEIRPPVDFDLLRFVQNLISHDALVEIRYYIGKIKRVEGNAKSEMMYVKQQKLVSFLQTQKVVIGFGHLIAYPDGTFHEKGIDVLIAVEMIKLALQKKYDVAYLFSSDTDLVPAVEECINLGREVVYVGSSVHGQSFGLTKASSRTILLQPKDVLPFVPPKSA